MGYKYPNLQGDFYNPKKLANQYEGVELARAASFCYFVNVTIILFRQTFCLKSMVNLTKQEKEIIKIALVRHVEEVENVGRLPNQLVGAIAAQEEYKQLVKDLIVKLS